MDEAARFADEMASLFADEDTSFEERMQAIRRNAQRMDEEHEPDEA